VITGVAVLGVVIAATGLRRPRPAVAPALAAIAAESGEAELETIRL